jgi:PAS domain S-box-containing protein
MNKPLCILILEDQPADAELVTSELRKAGLEFVAKTVATEKEFLAELRNFAPQLILADYSLPGYDGLSALAAAQKECPETPFIFVSGSMGEERAIETLHLGATDYVLKQRPARLGPAVRRTLREQEERQKRQQAEREQHEAEARYRALFEESPDGIVVLDPETARPLEFNAAAHRQLGYSREEFARLSLADIEAKETLEQTRATIDEVRRGGRKDFETWQRTREGQIRHVAVTAQILGVSGRPVFHCIWRDITERKQAEQRVHELNLMVKASGAINALMVRERDRQRLLAEACKILVETRGYQFAWIGQVAPGPKRVVPTARAGKDAGYLDAVTITWDETPTGQGPMGTAIRTGQAVACQDTATDPRSGPWREEATARGFASVAAVPLIHGSRVLGAVAVYSVRTSAFPAEELELLKELAADLAFALQSIEHEQERKRAEESLGESERRFRLLFNSGYDAVFVHQGGGANNGSGKFIEVNDIACQRLGYTRKELLQMTPRDISAPETLPDIPGIRAKLAVDGSAISQGVHITKDGRRIPVEISTHVFELNGKPTRLSTVRDITERKRFEAALCESSQFNQQIVTSAQEGIVVHGRDLRYQIWNPFMEQLTGLPAGEVLGKHPDELFPFLREAGVLASIQKALTGEPTFSIDVHFDGLPTGKSGWTSRTNGPLRNTAGEIIGVIGIVRDITERKRTELQIEAFSKLGQRLSAAKTAREAARIISEVAAELLGWDACSFSLCSPSKDLLDHVLNVDTIDGKRVECSVGSEPASALARRTLETGGQLILKEEPDQMLPGSAPFGDETRPSASIMYVPVRQGPEVIGVMSIQSYTPGAYDARSLETLQALADHCGGALDRIRLEEAWQTTQQRLGRLLAQSPAVIYSLKTDGQTTEPAWVSENVERLLGYTAAECNGPEGLFKQVHPQDRQDVIDSLLQLLSHKQVARDCRVRHKNGDYRWLRDEQRLVCDAAGAAVEIVGSWVDITERKGLEVQLRQAQKMEAVGQLAGGVAHDFNNMLAVIRGNAELLLMDEGQHTAETREGLQHVVEASERAANLTRQLLTFSRKQVLLPQPLVLNEVIANLTKMLNRVIGENIDLQCQYAAPLPYVQADTGMLEQVILNLVVNARDAMPEGGQLRVATAHSQIDEAHARVNPGARAGDFVYLSVSDTGTGIAPEHLTRIFEPFFTTKEIGKGTGLGLATVYGIVQQHQGWVEVSSQVGEGTTFKVFLPAIPAPAQSAAASEAAAEVRGGTETILLVEDEHAVRITIRRVLESSGYTIREATSAQEALELWHSHAGEIALLLTDIIMPGGMSGRDLAERLWGQKPGLKVLFMSGYSADVLGKNTEFIRRTKSHFLQKPSSSRVILETVRQSLDEKEPEAAPAEAGPTK